jgi:glycosyltransferase involved in cell wall biosynthesis
MASEALVSVAIPSYNAAATLGQTLDSVLTQTHRHLQVVVVNDGSRDDTPAVLARYADRIEAIDQPNGGLAKARNRGCRAAKAEFIALMDADDLCRPERIALQVAYLQAHPDVVLCSGDFVGFNDDGVLPEMALKRYYSRVANAPGGIADFYPAHEVMRFGGRDVQTRRGAVYEAIALGNFVHPPTIMFRRSLLEQCGLFDESIANMCDHDWLVRASRCGAFGYIAEPLLDYRISARQMSGARHRVQVALDIAFVLDKTCRDDPGLAARHSPQLRRLQGEAYLSAADALCDSQPLAAFVMLWRATRCGVVTAQSAKAMVKCLLPAPVLKRIRSWL